MKTTRQPIETFIKEYELPLITMKYYELKRRAFFQIDDMLKQGVPIPHIVLKISSKYGFGKSVVMERVNMHNEAKEASKELMEEKKDEPRPEHSSKSN